MQAIRIPATDGYPLAAYVYEAALQAKNHKVLIINSATAVSRKLYHHYAHFMTQNGYEVITYDYRGIADSRPKKLRGFEASFTIWGQKDFSGVLRFAENRFPNHKMLVFGHSIGGTIIGMTAYCNTIQGAITIGAQSAYYKDWAKKERLKIYLLWHLFFPAVTSVFGYFPGKKLNMLEDVPKGVIAQWHDRKNHPDIAKSLEKRGIRLYYHLYTSKLLTLGVADDPIGTPKAIERIHDLFGSRDKKLEILSPKEAGVVKIGHFGFFSRKFKPTLWTKTLAWFDTL